MDDIAEMLEAAGRARDNAHAPYSGFAVGACLASDDGRLFAGCNVENAAYPQSQCAEAGAIAAMVAAGGRRIAAVLVLAGGPALCPPCGGCRQRLAEFAGPEANELAVRMLQGEFGDGDHITVDRSPDGSLSFVSAARVAA